MQVIVFFWHHVVVDAIRILFGASFLPRFSNHMPLGFFLVQDCPKSATKNATENATKNVTKNATENATKNVTKNATKNATKKNTRPIMPDQKESNCAKKNPLPIIIYYSLDPEATRGKACCQGSPLSRLVR